MAIITSTEYINGYAFTYTRSDAERYIVRDGIAYGEAYDPPELNRTYIEGDTITTEEDKNKEILNILLGGEGNNNLEHAHELRTIIEECATTLSDEIAITVPEMFPYWNETVTYTNGDRVRHNDTLYKCLQSHNSNATYSPDMAVSLWARVLTDPSGEILPWEQPESTNPYMKGDKVSYNGHIYECIIDYNIYAPDVYGWEMI